MKVHQATVKLIISLACEISVVYLYILYAFVMLSHFLCACIFESLYFLSLHSLQSSLVSVSFQSFVLSICMYVPVHFLIKYLYLSDSASQYRLTTCKLVSQLVSQFKLAATILFQWCSYTTISIDIVCTLTQGVLPESIILLAQTVFR